MKKGGFLLSFLVILINKPTIDKEKLKCKNL